MAAALKSVAVSNFSKPTAACETRKRFSGGSRNGLR